jgi:hypothetical protein
MFLRFILTSKEEAIMDTTALKSGDVEPTLGKKIKDIILASSTFIVYMDENDVIQWSSDKDDKMGDIPNQISYWESLSNKLFPKEEAYDYKCLLAEGYARVLDEGNTVNAQKIIDLTSDRIKKHGKELLRQQYLLASLLSTIIVGIILVITITSRTLVSSLLGSHGYGIFLTGLFGGIGAFVSAMTRSTQYDPEISIGKEIHVIDGILRIIYGLLVASLIAIGIKANLVFGFINNTDKNIFILTFMGAISGASELIFPSIVKKVEEKV